MKEFKDILEEINHNLEWCDDAYQCRCYRRSRNEITRLRAENEKLGEALKQTLAIASRTMRLTIMDRASAAIEGVKEPASPKGETHGQ